MGICLKVQNATNGAVGYIDLTNVAYGNNGVLNSVGTNQNENWDTLQQVNSSSVDKPGRRVNVGDTDSATVLGTNLFSPIEIWSGHPLSSSSRLVSRLTA